MLFCHYNAKGAYLCRRYDESHELCNELFVQRNAYFQYLDKSYYLTGAKTWENVIRSVWSSKILSLETKTVFL